MSRKQRRKFSDDQKSQAVDDFVSGRKSAADLAKEHNIAQGQIYKWKSQFEEGKIRGRINDLEAGGMSSSEARHMRCLEDENEVLKKKLAEEVIIVDLLKKLQPSSIYPQLKNASGSDEIAELLAQSKKRVRR